MDVSDLRLGLAVSLLKAIRADASVSHWHGPIDKCINGMNEPRPELDQIVQALRQKADRERERDEYRKAHEANVREHRWDGA